MDTDEYELAKRFRTGPIRSPAGVCAGRTIIDGTRIGVHDVIGLLQNGETIDTLIPRCFPDLKRSQVYECLAYYEDHRPEIDRLVAEQMAEDSRSGSSSITTCRTISHCSKATLGKMSI